MIEKQQVKQMNTTVLAYIGDGIYELLIRKYVIEKGSPHIDAVHKKVVKYVNGTSQAKALKVMFDELTEEEQRLAKRARNRKSLSKPKNIDPVTYKLATAFEALIGYLHLTGNNERVEQIVDRAIEIIEEKDDYE